jgi:hypothetical protein
MITLGKRAILNFLNHVTNGSILEAITTAVKTTRTISFIKNKNHKAKTIRTPLKIEPAVIFIVSLE